LLLFAALGGVLHDAGGVPFREEDLQVLKFQPAFDQVDLRGFARPVQPIHRDESAGIGVPSALSCHDPFSRSVPPLQAILRKGIIYIYFTAICQP
jgi:hypothetical protein